MSNYDVLVVSAHPDDAEMNIGGTLIKLCEAGLSLFHLALTAGQFGTYGEPASRKIEFQAALDFLGAKGRILSHLDTELEHTIEIRRGVAGLIRELRPKVIFAPYHSNPVAERGGIAHTDHFTAGAIVRDAAKLARLKGVQLPHAPHEVKRLYFFMMPTFSKPHVVVDVSDKIDQTMALIRCYSSQLSITRNSLGIEEILRTKRASLGIDVGTGYAEGLLVDEPLHFSARNFIEL